MFLYALNGLLIAHINTVPVTRQFAGAPRRRGKSPHRLSAAPPLKTGTFSIDDRESVCVLVSLDETRTRSLFDSILSASAAPVDVEMRDTLFRVFTGAGR